MKKYEECAKKFGTVEFDGKEYALTEQAYIQGQNWEEVHFLASAIDREENEYMIRWEVDEDFTEEYAERTDDFGSACNWEKPSDVWAR